MYQVIMFDRSVNDFYVLNESEAYAICVQEAISHIYKEIDRWNQLNVKSRLDYPEYDEILEIFENGQNYIINNKVFGVISIGKIEYHDYLLCISGGKELDDNDIKALQIPFENRKYFNDYMMRVCLSCGGCYNLINLDEADNIAGEIGVNDYIIRVKIAY